MADDYSETQHHDEKESDTNSPLEEEDEVIAPAFSDATVSMTERRNGAVTTPVGEDANMDPSGEENTPAITETERRHTEEKIIDAAGNTLNAKSFSSSYENSRAATMTRRERKRLKKIIDSGGKTTATITSDTSPGRASLLGKNILTRREQRRLENKAKKLNSKNTIGISTPTDQSATTRAPRPQQQQNSPLDTTTMIHGAIPIRGVGEDGSGSVISSLTIVIGGDHQERNSRSDQQVDGDQPPVITANLVDDNVDEERVRQQVNDYIQHQTVPAIHVDQVDEEQPKTKTTRLLLICFFTIAVALGVVLTMSDDSSSDLSTPTTSMAPSEIPSLAPTFFRYEFLVQTLGPNITDDLSVFQNESTIEHLALNWMAENDESKLIDDLYRDPTRSPQVFRKLVERYAVAVLYMYYVYPSHRIDPLPLHTCNFILDRQKESPFNCTDDVFIDEIWIDGHDLYGTIATELGLLSGLRVLNLNGNSLTGTLPSELFYLSKLEVLDVGNNHLSSSISSEIGFLSNTLAFLDLRVNEMTSAMPNEVGKLSKLTYLDLKLNYLTSAIPSEIGLLSNLSHLDLSLNYLNSTIPAEVGMLSKLTHLNLRANELTSAIPTQIGMLPKLLHLGLDWNSLNSAIPTEIGMLWKLTRLSLDWNGLTLTIPTEIGKLSNLTFLGLGSNALEGNIPTEIGQLTRLTWLYLDDQFPEPFPLQGSLPSVLGHLTLLKVLNAQNNLLEGSLPSELGQLTLLESMYLDGNLLEGSIPSELQHLTMLNNIHLENNLFTGGVEEVFCSLGRSYLIFLSDCGGPDPEIPICSCCTDCCDREGSCTDPWGR